MTDVTVPSLTASLLHKLSEATDRLCQIALNQKLKHKFEKWCKFSSHIQAILCKEKSSKRRRTCITYLLTPWSRVLLEKLTGSAASQEIPHIFGTRRFITVLTSARHLSLS